MHEIFWKLWHGGAFGSDINKMGPFSSPISISTLLYYYGRHPRAVARIPTHTYLFPQRGNCQTFHFPLPFHQPIFTLFQGRTLLQTHVQRGTGNLTIRSIFLSHSQQSQGQNQRLQYSTILYLLSTTTPHFHSHVSRFAGVVEWFIPSLW